LKKREVDSFSINNTPSHHNHEFDDLLKKETITGTGG